MDQRVMELRRKLKDKLPPARYEHSLSVSFTAMALAMRYGCPLSKAELAGILHDCAKRYPDGEILIKCGKKGLRVTEDERLAPMVLHAKYGAWMAEHKYGVQDEEILSAIRWHTTGKADMSLLDKIIYIADYIEPRRNKADGLEEMRRLAFVDLDRALLGIMEGTIRYLEKKGGYIDRMSLDAYRYYKGRKKSHTAEQKI